MARMTLEHILAREPTIDQAKLDATTEADIERHMREDGEDPEAPLGPYVRVYDARTVRERAGMSQTEFADALCIPVATLRNWEQFRTIPDPAAQSLLRIVMKIRVAALAALAKETPAELGWDAKLHVPLLKDRPEL